MHKIEGRALTEGGLYGEYFENSDLSDHGLRPNSSLASLLPPFVRKDRLIDFNWTKSERPCGPPAMINKDIGPDYFSARWKVSKTNLHEPSSLQSEATCAEHGYMTCTLSHDFFFCMNGNSHDAARNTKHRGWYR